MGAKSGVTGSVLLTIAAIFSLVLSIILLANALTVNQVWYKVTAAVASLLLAIGIVLVAKGTRALGKHYKNGVASATGIVGLIAGILSLIVAIIEIIVGVLPLVIAVPAILASALIILGIITLILMGVFLILLGVSFIVLRAKIGQSGLSMATGILSIISGAMFCSVLIAFIGMIILIPTTICSALLFGRVKGIPSEKKHDEEEKPEKVKEFKGAKKLAVRVAEPKVKTQLKPAEIEAGVYKYVKQNPGGIDAAECADELGVSEAEVNKAINSLVRKGKLELGG
jgi:hypothetical protein